MKLEIFKLDLYLMVDIIQVYSDIVCMHYMIRSFDNDDNT